MTAAFECSPSPALSFINIFIESDKLLTFRDIMNGPGVSGGRGGGGSGEVTGIRPKGLTLDLQRVYSAGDI